VVLLDVGDDGLVELVTSDAHRWAGHDTAQRDDGNLAVPDLPNFNQMGQ
jgi:hypothetical protein